MIFDTTKEIGDFGETRAVHYLRLRGYTVKEPKVGFLGTSDEILFFITFDENGVAKKCEEGYRPGG
jgi:hypothetical protein